MEAPDSKPSRVCGRAVSFCRPRRLLCALLLLLTAAGSFAQETIDLQGVWDLSVGDSAHYDDYVLLPGSMLTNGKGDDVTAATRWTGSTYDSSYYFNPYLAQYRQEGNVKYPFFLTPAKHYEGTAWYRRGIYVPQSWEGRHLTLLLERPHIVTSLYVNGQPAGSRQSLSVPHVYDVSQLLRPGCRNTIAVCVSNVADSVGVGPDSHSVSDQTQGNWNGIVGRMELRAQPASFRIEKVRVTPLLRYAVLHLDIDIGGMSAFSFRRVPDLMVAMERGDAASDAYIRYFEVDGPKLSVDVPLPEKAALWDEFHPHYYRLGITLGDDYYETTFGLRDMAAYGRQLYLNGHPIWLRGTVGSCCFPETGYPPTDEDSWTRIFTKLKDYGLNHVRFHSYCPPEAAFVAADKLGLYLQPEGPTWPNHGVALRRGQRIDQYLLEESKRIVDAYGHHPSFVMMAAGNEPAGDWVGYCNEWVGIMKAYDPTKLYCGASVGGGWAWDSGSEYHVKGGARGLDWDRHAPQSVDDYYSQIEYPRNYQEEQPNQSPIVAHEQGQWCAFPDFREIGQYTGVYKARNFEIFRDLLRKNGMEQQADKFLHASGKLQTLAYKYEIERNLRTKDYAGFQLLGLNDYSGQGTALVGVLNVHWREKGYVDAAEWRQFCSPLVALAKFPKFVYSNRDTLRVDVEACNALYGEVEGLRSHYYISDDSARVFAGGLLFTGKLPMGKNSPLGTVTLPLDSIDRPTKLTLTVKLAGKLSNHWDFWVYPETPDSLLETQLHVTDTLDAAALGVLQGGGKVLLTAAGKVRLGSDVVQHYLPVFWNTSWFKMRPPHTTGAYIDTSHPLFKYGFPTDDWANLNWWELLNRAQVMNLMELPLDYQPPIQPIDTWHVSRKLGMLVEANVLKGKLLMTTLDVSSRLDRRLVARQMRQAILRYMESDDFQPTLTLDPQTIGHFFTKDAPKVDMFTNDSPDELKPKLTSAGR